MTVARVAIAITVTITAVVLTVAVAVDHLAMRLVDAGAVRMTVAVRMGMRAAMGGSDSGDRGKSKSLQEHFLLLSLQ